MQIKPIKSNDDYKAALKEIRTLWSAEPNTPQGDKLDILITLVEAYENKFYHIDPPEPIEAIKSKMEQKGLRKIDLVHMVGGKNRVTEVLSRKKPLTINMIKNIHSEMGIPLESLIGYSRTHVFRNTDRIMQDTDRNSGPRRLLCDNVMEVA